MLRLPLETARVGVVFYKPCSLLMMGLFYAARKLEILYHDIDYHKTSFCLLRPSDWKRFWWVEINRYVYYGAYLPFVMFSINSCAFYCLGKMITDNDTFLEFVKNFNKLYKPLVEAHNDA